MKKFLFLILWSFLFTTQGNAGILINSGLSHEYTMPPGGQVEGKITVRNTDDTPVQVRIYQTDYLFSASGETVYGEPGSAPRSNAGWISFSPARLTIPPRDAATVYYAVQAPARPEWPGTYWSILMVEPVAEITDDSRPGEKNKFRIQTVVRYGIQIVTDVGASAERRIRFLEKKLVYEGSQKFLQIDIENIGEKWLFPLVWVEVYNKEGNSMGRFECSRARIFPGCSLRQMAEMTKVPPGDYRVLVVVDDEEGFAVGAQYNLKVE